MAVCDQTVGSGRALEPDRDGRYSSSRGEVYRVCRIPRVRERCGRVSREARRSAWVGAAADPRRTFSRSFEPRVQEEGVAHAPAHHRHRARAWVGRRRARLRGAQGAGDARLIEGAAAPMGTAGENGRGEKKTTRCRRQPRRRGRWAAGAMASGPGHSSKVAEAPTGPPTACARTSRPIVANRCRSLSVPSAPAMTVSWNGAR